MLQETIWMRFLLTGFNLSLLLLFGSCDKHEEYRVTGTFVYKNETEHQIQVQSIKPFELGPSEQFTIEEIMRGPQHLVASDYVPPFLDAILVFDAQKCDTLNTLPGTSVGEGPGITGIQNYASEQIDTCNFKFTYTFTLADYESASECE